MRIVPLMVAAIFLTACGAKTQLPTIDPGLAEAEADYQRLLAVQDIIKFNKQLAPIAYAIRKENGTECNGFAAVSGLQYLAITDPDYSKVLQDHYQVGDNILIYSVVEDSSPWHIGMREGDRLIEVNGKAVTPDNQKALMGELEGLVTARQWVPVKWRNEAGDVMQNAFAGTLVCQYPINMVNQDIVNAWADGRSINITKGMIRFTESDDELALILGHELAHNTMAHSDAKMGQAIGGAILDGLLAVVGVPTGGMFSEMASGIGSQEYEAEADYVGAYYSARAGYDVRSAAGLWRRMAANHPEAIHMQGTTHPSTAKRYLALDATAAEIDERLAAGEDLAPRMAEN